MASDWVEDWCAATGGTLTSDQLQFLGDVEQHFGPGTRGLWSANREFVRFALEGPAAAPQLVCYLRWQARHPGQLIAYKWIPLPRHVDSGDLDPAVWYANCLEELEVGHHPDASPDGIIRLSA